MVLVGSCLVSRSSSVVPLYILLMIRLANFRRGEHWFGCFSCVMIGFLLQTTQACCSPLAVRCIWHREDGTKVLYTRSATGSADLSGTESVGSEGVWRVSLDLGGRKRIHPAYVRGGNKYRVVIDFGPAAVSAAFLLLGRTVFSVKEGRVLCRKEFFLMAAIWSREC